MLLSHSQEDCGSIPSFGVISLKRRPFGFILTVALVFTVVLTVFATCVSLLIAGWRPQTWYGITAQKASEIQGILDTYYVGEYNDAEMSDLVADAIVHGLDDRWSYYVPADESLEHTERSENAYCGIGITIRESDEYFEIISVTENGPAFEAGIKTGEYLAFVDGNDVTGLTIDEVKSLVRGQEGTSVQLGIKNGQNIRQVAVTRRKIDVIVAHSEILDDHIGYIKIDNFDDKCALQTISEIEKLMEQNVDSIVFDVRYNPGGHKDELVELLDHLLPEGVVFRDESYDGTASECTSDASFLDIPMAVLVNENSYSAAEFFAAVLQEYDKAIIVGEKTVGKGFYQTSFDLLDGSVLCLSIGKYFTPQGHSLEGVGIVPDVPVKLSEEDAAALYLGQLAKENDSQIQAAVEALCRKTDAEKS